MTQATSNQATAREAREWLLNQPSLPEGVTVGVRGRLSKQAKEHFTANTGQEVASPVAADSAE
jgi:hypothetical protein